MEDNTDLPEFIVAQELACLTSGFCLCLFKGKGRMVTFCFMPALHKMLNIHQESHNSYHFKESTSNTQKDVYLPLVIFFADNYQKLKIISTQ